MPDLWISGTSGFRGEHSRRRRRWMLREVRSMVKWGIRKDDVDTRWKATGYRDLWYQEIPTREVKPPLRGVYVINRFQGRVYVPKLGRVFVTQVHPDPWLVLRDLTTLHFNLYVTGNVGIETPDAEPQRQ